MRGCKEKSAFSWLKNEQSFNNVSARVETKIDIVHEMCLDDLLGEGDTFFKGKINFIVLL